MEHILVRGGHCKGYKEALHLDDPTVGDVKAKYQNHGGFAIRERNTLPVMPFVLTGGRA